MDKLILVTGATGYIASRLIPRLLEAGYRVRCLARDPSRLTGRSWSHQVEVVKGDVTMPSTLSDALQGVHTAYYLIHNMSYGHGYTELELKSARAFIHAAAQAGVEHIIYLGGLADPEQHIAPHMRSRIETGRVLREGKVPVTEFRAGVITGSGSISFEMIRFMTELFPVVPGPLWMRNRSQPIAMQNVIDYLVAALTNPGGRGGVFEIGGPDITTYGDLMLRYARLRGLRRSMFLIPGLPVWFMAFGVGLMTPVPYPIAHALIGGLSADSVVKHPEALQIFPEVKLVDYDSAAKDALEKTHPIQIERVWDHGNNRADLPASRPGSKHRSKTSEIRKTLKHEGCFIDHREVEVGAGPQNTLQAITEFGVREHRRGTLSVLAPASESEPLNSKTFLFHFKKKHVGRQWIEWRLVSRAASVTYVTQTVFFCPHGLPGFVYWFLLYPFHLIQIRGLIKAITGQSKQQ